MQRALFNVFIQGVYQAIGRGLDKRLEELGGVRVCEVRGRGFCQFASVLTRALA